MLKFVYDIGSWFTPFNVCLMTSLCRYLILFKLLAGVFDNMEIATEMAASKPLRQSGTVSKPVRKPVETSSVHDTGDDDEELEDDEDGVEATGGKNAVIWCSMLRKKLFFRKCGFSRLPP